MKAILMSIKPKWCERIFSGEKTIEVRKTAPKLKPPFKVYVYQTKYRLCNKFINEVLNTVYDGCKVIGEFVCDEKHDIQFTGASYLINNDISLTNSIAKQSCLWFDDMFSYLGVKGGAALHITKVKLYDKPKELEVFWSVRCTNKTGDCEKCEVKPACINNITRAPQSWMYVEEIKE